MARPVFTPAAALPGLIPGLAIVAQYPGASEHNVFLTCGCANVTAWIRGRLDGASRFASLEEADDAARAAGGYLARRGDHFVYIGRGGCFDPKPAA